MNKRQKSKIQETLSNVRGIIRHIKNVQDNCILLGEKLIELGEIELGKNLIANGLQHDASKFKGIEYEFMAPFFSKKESADVSSKKMKLRLAIHHHQSTNPHHVEYWGNEIIKMPEIYLAEFCCDIKARSEEFGTSLMDYINDEGIKRWKISKDDSVYKKIIKYVNLLCEKPFAATP
jgi:hypothetical protein